MKKYGNIMLLLLCASTSCGFIWGDPCSDAKNGVRQLSVITDESRRNKEEDKILKACPDGAAGRFVEALRKERRGDVEQAIAGYRDALRHDDGIAEAHGNLGLLLLKTGETAAASVELTKGVIGTSDPRYHKALARILTTEKMYPLAIFHYHEAEKAFPADRSIHAGLAEAYSSTGDFGHAEKEYLWLLKADPADETARIDLAGMYRKSNRLDDALGHVRKAIAANPQNRELHKLIAEIHMDRHDLEAARKEYLLAGVDYRVDPLEYVRKGDRLQAAGDYVQAILAYQTALKAEPGSPETYRKLGEAQMAAGKDDEAIASYQAAIRGGASTSDLYYNLGVVYERKGMLDEAAGEYRQTLKLFPANGDARRRLADIHSVRGDFVQAIEQYKELIRVRGDNPLLHFKLGKAYEKTRSFSEATAEFQEAARLDPDNMEAHRELAALYQKRGLLDGAAEQYREILRLKKDASDARNALTAIYVKNRKYDDLLTLLREGVELAPQDPSSHYKLGIIHEFRKEYEPAIAAYEKTIALKSDHAKAHNALGRLFLKTGRVAEAKEALEAAKKADPELAEPILLLSSIRNDLSSEPPRYTKKKTAKKNVTAKSKKKSTRKKKAAKVKSAVKKKKATSK